MARKKVAKLATFLTVLVANFFSTRHGDQNSRSLERCIPNASVILARNEMRLQRNETRLARNEMRGGNLLLSGTVGLLVSLAAVLCLVTQRSSPQTAAHIRTTFLSHCFCSLMKGPIMDQQIENDASVRV